MDQCRVAVPRQADKTNMNIIERKSVNAGKKVTQSSKGGKFVSAMQRLAKLRSPSRSKNPLQVGNTLTKKAPMKGGGSFTSGINKPEGNGNPFVQATEGQTALNKNQRGASNKNSQRRGFSDNSQLGSNDDS